MKQILGFLLLLPTMANALCLDFYFDKDGQTHAIRCGSNWPEVQCRGTTYWNGQACVPIEIAKICESYSGEWSETHVDTVIGLTSDNIKRVLHESLHVCACPDQLVWDGEKCRSDIPLDQQCTVWSDNTPIQMTKEFCDSKNLS